MENRIIHDKCVYRLAATKIMIGMHDYLVDQDSGDKYAYGAYDKLPENTPITWSGARHGQSVHVRWMDGRLKDLPGTKGTWRGQPALIFGGYAGPYVVDVYVKENTTPFSADVDNVAIEEIEYEIEKRTPAGNWQTVHTGVTNPAGLMAEIARNYDSDRETPFMELEAAIQEQLDDPSRGYAVMSV
ncbi:MAG: hypothetical protein E6R04_06275, partial [Spirochaetes bacterium]